MHRGGKKDKSTYIVNVLRLNAHSNLIEIRPSSSTQKTTPQWQAVKEALIKFLKD